MLLMLTGSSCSGKTTIARACAHLDRLAIRDFDEAGVPVGADTRWRQRTMERWIEAAFGLQGQRIDLLLAGQSPLGEILASPSAVRLDGIAVCLLDVDDHERLHRLERRDPGQWSDAARHDLLQWARWHREHVADPQSRRQAITRYSWNEMRWDRWVDWSASDPRWSATVIDTTGRPLAQTTSEVSDWINDARAALAMARLPLAQGWSEADWPAT